MTELLCPRAAIDADGTIICTAMRRPMLCIMYDCDLWIGRRMDTETCPGKSCYSYEVIKRDYPKIYELFLLVSS